MVPRIPKRYLWQYSYGSVQPRFSLELKDTFSNLLLSKLQEDKIEDSNSTPDKFGSLADVTKVENTGSKLENKYIEDINNDRDNAMNVGVPASNNLDAEDNSNAVEIVERLVAASAEVEDGNVVNDAAVSDTKTVSDRCV